MEVKFSFLKLFNSIKGVGKPEPQHDATYLETKATEATKKKFERFFNWCHSNGIEHPKLQYPVLFGTGENQYPGMLATEDIGKDEVMIKVPSSMVISTHVAFYSDIKHIFYENPDLFGKHTADGEDNVLCTYVLYELGKGEKSFWHPMFEVWPKETDILMNWDYEDLQWLQDPTLEENMNEQYQDFLSSWNQLYQCLTRYPDYFKEDSISLYRYKWVYILTTNRCFGSNWPGVCAMIPYAELINHENTDVAYDYLDKEGQPLKQRKEEKEKQKKEERLYNIIKKRQFFDELKTDLLKLETELKQKLVSEGKEVPEAGPANVTSPEKDYSLKPSLGDGSNRKNSGDSDDDEKHRIEHPSPKGDDYDYSSGIDSDNDVDLLVEQEVITALRLRKEMLQRDEDEQYSRGEKAVTGKLQQVLTNDEAFDVWEKTLARVDKEYQFVIRTYNDTFPKGSQVYLCYGRMSNREMLKRYGFCLTFNKYNHLFIKLRLDSTDPEFEYRKFVLKKFFSVDPSSEKMDISSRHFKIYFQRLNTKVLKFVKILNFNLKDDDISCIIETRSLSLEFISLQKLKKVYEEFLESFPTSLSEDQKILKEKRSTLSSRQYFALVYRTEQKKILGNQIKLLQIVLHILERLMKGMTMEYAVARVFELESKKEVVVNRIMIDNYLTSLQNGMKRNQEDYMKSEQVSESQMKSELQKYRLELPKVAYRQFEIKGYDKMIERILEAPLKSCQQNNNTELQGRLLLIKDSLQEQINRQRQLKAEEAASQQNEESSEYGSEYESEDEEADLKKPDPSADPMEEQKAE